MKYRQFRSLAYYIGFDALQKEREERGISLERMTELINQIGETDEAFIPVTLEELQAVEADRLHGLNLAAAMYVRFFDCHVQIHGPKRGTQPAKFVSRQRKHWKAKMTRIQEKAEAVRDMGSPKADVRSVQVAYNLDSGERRMIQLKITRDMPEWGMMHRLLLRLVKKEVASVRAIGKAAWLLNK